jgi:hypothetical protein
VAVAAMPPGFDPPRCFTAVRPSTIIISSSWENFASGSGELSRASASAFTSTAWLNSTSCSSDPLIFAEEESPAEIEAEFVKVFVEFIMLTLRRPSLMLGTTIVIFQP